MIKNYTLSLLFICFSFCFGFGQVTDLIISEYVEGSGNNKYIEIYNGTGSQVDLSDYQLRLYANGSASPTNTSNLGGSLNNGATIVYRNSSASEYTGTTTLDLTVNFNGDDAIALWKISTASFIDIFGRIGNDPGSAWTATGGYTTTNKTLVRKPNVCAGITVSPTGSGPGAFTTLLSEWDIYDEDDVSNLGIHNEICSATNTFVEFATTNSSLDEDGLVIDVCASITNPSASTATTVDLVLDPSSTATNGADYDDGAGIPAAISFPVSLTFPANSSANQCFTFYISNDDLLVEGDETVVLNLTNATGGDAAVIGSNDQHILTIVDNDAPTIADVVITEIMYNTFGTDDEWIEICNVSGSAQVLNNYTIRVGASTEFTFPSTGALIADGNCITVSLGDGGGTEYNVYCEFTPDYTNGSGTGTLNNTSDTIVLIASDGSTQIDSVTYNSGDGGNTTSLHVIDASLNNDNTATNWQDVINGGSPGINSLISPCTPIGPEINVEGTTAGFPNISNGDLAPIPFDGTNFGGSNIGTALTNSFRIENFGGTTNLNISSVTVLSGDVADFSISALPASIIPALGSSNFDIDFNPTTEGTRTAIIQIISNDADENPYTFAVTGLGLCVASSITASPNSGPTGTIVTIAGTNLGAATASINGQPISVNNVSESLIEVTIPFGATTGNIEVLDSIGCPAITSFTVIKSQITSCEGSSGPTPSDLFISEVTDATLGGLTYVELYNGTGGDININNYSIEVINNGGTAPSPFNILDLENVVVADGDTYVIAIGRSTPINSSDYCTSITGGSGELASSANAQFINGGINKRAFEHDVIRLVNSGTTIDEFGVYQDNDWMDSTIITGDRGFNFRRSNAATMLPDPTFTLAELSNWEVIDWVGSGTGSCSLNDYSNIGTFDFSTGTPPTVNSISDTTSSCNEVTITVSATEGFSGGNELRYTWYAFNPAQAGLGWQELSTGGIYTTVNTSPDLIISDAASVLDYQFYCEVREDDASCFSASNAIKITLATATWDGTTWLWNDGTPAGTAPNLATNVVLNGNFDTSGPGLQDSFEACSLTINNVSLNIADGDFVEVVNDLNVTGAIGAINIEPEGSFIQINDFGTLNATDPSKLQVNKLTAPSNNWYEYTYWSSPVVQETPEVGLASSNPNRRYQFNAWNFRDSFFESANDNTFIGGAGIDDIDDAAPYDWQPISTTYLVPGRGYASTHDPATFASSLDCPGPTCRINYIFSGLFNNGEIPVTLYRNDSEPDDTNWNFVGNPYPSAISADAFLDTNLGIINQSIPEPNPIIEGAIYLWSQNTEPTNTTNGNQNLNFSQSDYAIINGTGQTAAQSPGGDATLPSRHIPSGQGFFIAMHNDASATPVIPNPVPGDDIQTADLIFNNAMRVRANNNQFFRNNATENNQDHKLWLNLTTDHGVFSQVLVGYLEHATDEYDGMYFDAPRNGSSEVNSFIYTKITDNTKKFVIQGKNANSLNIDEKIPLGFYSSISEPTDYNIAIGQTEGAFMLENTIYIIDNLNNTLHNLKNSNYSFTSQPGEFNNRFEIVFTPNALAIKDHQITPNDLNIRELSNGDVEFSITNTVTIAKVEILDILGRQIYRLTSSSAREVYNLSKLSKAPYIAKVTLSSGQTITKKAVKRY